MVARAVVVAAQPNLHEAQALIQTTRGSVALVYLGRDLGGTERLSIVGQTRQKTAGDALIQKKTEVKPLGKIDLGTGKPAAEAPKAEPKKESAPAKTNEQIVNDYVEKQASEPKQEEESEKTLVKE